MYELPWRGSWPTSLVQTQLATFFCVGDDSALAVLFFRCKDVHWPSLFIQTHRLSSVLTPLRENLGLLCLLFFGLYICVYMCVYVCVYVCMCAYRCTGICCSHFGSNSKGCTCAHPSLAYSKQKKSGMHMHLASQIFVTLYSHIFCSGVWWRWWWWS